MIRERNNSPEKLNQEYTKSVVNNPAGYKFLTLISMTYVSLMIGNAVLTNRGIGTDTLFVLICKPEQLQFLKILSHKR